MQQQRIAKGHGRLRFWKNQELGVRDAVEQRGNSEDKTNERAAGAYIEERTVGANGRTHQNKRTEGPDQRWERNEERVTGMNVVAAAGEKMAEFVGQ